MQPTNASDAKRFNQRKRVTGLQYVLESVGLRAVQAHAAQTKRLLEQEYAAAEQAEIAALAEKSASMAADSPDWRQQNEKVKLVYAGHISDKLSRQLYRKTCRDIAKIESSNAKRTARLARNRRAHV